MSTPVLTVARHALWRAIDEWPALANAFRSKLRYDDGGELPVEAGVVGFGKLPGITITPAKLSPKWVAHRIQSWETELTVTIQTPHWNLTAAERIVEAVIEAAYQCGPNGVGLRPSYVEAALCGPLEFTGVVFRPAKLGTKKPNARAMESVISFVLRPRVDPQGTLL